MEYNPDTGLFRWKQVRGGPQSFEWRPGTPKGDGYYLIRVNNRLYRAHRLAWFYMYGDWPVKQIDHIDGNRGNNKIKNLRDVSGSKNMENYHYLRKLKGIEHWKKVAAANRKNKTISH